MKKTIVTAAMLSFFATISYGQRTTEKDISQRDVIYLDGKPFSGPKGNILLYEDTFQSKTRWQRICQQPLEHDIVVLNEYDTGGESGGDEQMVFIQTPFFGHHWILVMKLTPGMTGDEIRDVSETEGPEGDVSIIIFNVRTCTIRTELYKKPF